jgi:hypothetical protein
VAPAQSAQQAAGDVERLRAVGKVDQRPARHEPLEQQRA